MGKWPLVKIYREKLLLFAYKKNVVLIYVPILLCLCFWTSTDPTGPWSWNPSRGLIWNKDANNWGMLGSVFLIKITVAQKYWDCFVFISFQAFPDNIEWEHEMVNAGERVTAKCLCMKKFDMISFKIRTNDSHWLRGPYACAYATTPEGRWGQLEQSRCEIILFKCFFAYSMLDYLYLLSLWSQQCYNTN